jgi:hypothetical protein
MVTTPLDDALAKTYVDFNVPVDHFIGNPELTQAFVAAVHSHAGESSLDAQAMMRRLVNLRKKGLLPRLRRAYNGRNGSQN